jgi:hypothetical protein
VLGCRSWRWEADVGVFRRKRHEPTGSETVEETLARLEAASVARDAARRAEAANARAEVTPADREGASARAGASERAATPAGWYSASIGGGRGLRYWDGAAWTNHFAPGTSKPWQAVSPDASWWRRALSAMERRVNEYDRKGSGSRRP